MGKMWALPGRRGLVFSLLTMLLLSPLIILSLNYSQSLRGYGRQLGSLTRAQEGFYFMESMHTDLERAGEIIGKRAIVSATSKVVTDGEGLDDAPKRLEELFMNGTLYGNSSALMQNSTINDWLAKIKDSAIKRSFAADVLPAVFTIDMHDSFTVRYKINYTILVEDQRGSFSLMTNITKTSVVPIDGLEDPLFPLHSLGRAFVSIPTVGYSNFTKISAQGGGANAWGSGLAYVVSSDDIVTYPNKSSSVLVTNNINTTNNATASLFAAVITQQLVSPATLSNPYIVNSSAMALISNGSRLAIDGSGGNVWDITNLYDSWSNQRYSSSSGPSFLDRLEGKFTNSYAGKGMETFVRKDILSSNGVPVTQSKTSIDYIYLSNQTLDGQRVRGMPDELRIDTQNQGFYNVQSLVY